MKRGEVIFRSGPMSYILRLEANLYPGGAVLELYEAPVQKRNRRDLGGESNES